MEFLDLNSQYSSKRYSDFSKIWPTRWIISKRHMRTWQPTTSLEPQKLSRKSMLNWKTSTPVNRVHQRSSNLSRFKSYLSKTKSSNNRRSTERRSKARSRSCKDRLRMRPTKRNSPRETTNHAKTPWTTARANRAVFKVGWLTQRAEWQEYKTSVGIKIIGSFVVVGMILFLCMIEMVSIPIARI